VRYCRILSRILDYLEKDEVVKRSLGPEYADYYIRVKREEWRQYHGSISEWETDNYLRLY
jgi:glutamine synthetase